MKVSKINRTKMTVTIHTTKHLVKAYYRLTKPGIVYGNAIAAIAGFLLASINGFDVTLFAATIIGISLVIASSCVVNNYTDKSIDSKMGRTKKRALVTGYIPVRNALLFALVLGTLGFALLIGFTNWLTVAIGCIGVFSYLVLYAIAKRKSWHGTLVGTISGATPPVAGYVAVSNQIDAAALLLFLVMVFWQMAHFYAIAMFRATDYKAAGIPVLPIVKGMAATKMQIIIYIAAFAVAAMLLPYYGYGGYVYSVTIVLTGLAWLWAALVNYGTIDDIAWSKKVFKYSLLALLIFSTMVATANVLP